MNSPSNTASSESIPLFDCDSHVSEPPDLWTSRLGKRFADAGVPRVEIRPDGVPRWVVGTQVLSADAKYASAGWRDFPPSHPPTLADADPASYHPGKRLERMDEYGVHAQVLYPNLVAFSSFAFRDLRKEVGLACVQAWNDFLIDFASEDPDRLIPLMMLPYWDVPASVSELERSVERGHRGVLLAGSFDRLGLPLLADPHWAPILEAAQHHDLSINFHIGLGNGDAEDQKALMEVPGDEHTRKTSVAMLGNAKAIADVICTGVCHQYPGLKFVSVESGVGWLPYLAESLDWHWLNFGGQNERPEREMPSFYLRRQVYGSFWFERESLRRVADLYPDNIMFETDFPHPTSLSPGPASSAETPRAMADKAVEGLPPELARKLLFDNGARLYHLN